MLTISARTLSCKFKGLHVLPPVTPLPCVGNSTGLPCKVLTLYESGNGLQTVYTGVIELCKEITLDGIGSILTSADQHAIDDVYGDFFTLDNLAP